MLVGGSVPVPLNPWQEQWRKDLLLASRRTSADCRPFVFHGKCGGLWQEDLRVELLGCSGRKPRCLSFVVLYCPFVKLPDTGGKRDICPGPLGRGWVAERNQGEQTA